MAGSESPRSTGLSNQQRSLLTLGLIIHFICVGTVLSVQPASLDPAGQAGQHLWDVHPDLQF